MMKNASELCLYATATVGDRTHIAALAGKMRQIGAVGEKQNYRFTTTGRSKIEECKEPEKCTTILTTAGG